MNSKRRRPSSGGRPARVTRSGRLTSSEATGGSGRPEPTGWRRWWQLACTHFVKGLASGAGSALVAFIIWLLS